VGLVEHDKKGLLTASNGEILRPEQHGINNTDHCADYGGQHFGR
jgi:hypothetical protein